ncbi:MAG: tyrosine-type recombinase/integrase [Angustibacter sp.]
MAARRGRGEASVYREGDRWRGALSLGYDQHGRRRRKKVTGRTKAEVLAKLREVQRQVAGGAPVPDDRITVEQFLRRWLTVSLPGHVEDSTLDGYADTARLHLVPTLGRRPLNRLGVAELDALWKAKRDAGYSSNSVRIMRTVLRKALSQAEREGLVLRNVAALSTPPQVVAEPGRSLTVDQARTLLDAVAGHRHAPLVLVMLTFGLRRGEALALRWADLDVGNRTLGVTSGLRRVRTREPDAPRRTRLVLTRLKTRRSRRVLFLPPPLVDVLVQHRGRQDEERCAAGSAWQDHGLIFPSEVGSPLDPDNFSHWFTRLCRTAGLGHWHPHDLRHSGASMMLALGVRLEVVSEVLGHASIAITKDVYGHLAEGDKRRAAESMSAALSTAWSADGSTDGSHGQVNGHPGDATAPLRHPGAGL